MATSFGALCTDFYVNQKLSMKMGLPTDRETILHMFERIRKSMPNMDRLRRFDGELALESPRRDPNYRWLALWGHHIRTGHVNPDSMEQAYKLHRLILEQTPFHLSISPLDVDHLELTFGFDLECRQNHDEIVADALFARTPLADLLNITDTKVLDLQPTIDLSLSRDGRTQASFEIRTRRRNRRGHAGRYRDDPISILLSVRQFGPINEIADLPRMLDALAEHAETLTTEKLVPSLLMPIARQITSSSA